jgi:integrase/recombinase XerC
VVAAPREYRPLTVDAALNEYTTHLDRRVAAGTLAAGTRGLYLRDLAEHASLIGVERLIDDLDTDELDDAVLAWSRRPDDRFTTPPAGSSQSSNTLTRHVASIRAFYTWAQTQGLVRRNPVEGMAVAPKPIKTAGRRLALDSTAADALEPVERDGWRAGFLQARDELCIRLLLETGIRVSELCAINVDDVVARPDGHWLLIRKGKGGKPRDVPLTAATVAFIHDPYSPLRPSPWYRDLADRRRDAERALLVTVRGRRITARTVQEIVDAAARRVGVSTTPHGLRHTMATRLVAERGVDVAIVQRLLGHSSPAITANAYLDDLTPGLRAAIGG